jgi:hypothetical protein
MSRKGKGAKNNKNVTIRLNTHELIMMNRASSEYGLSIGRLVKMAMKYNYSEHKESDLPKRITALELELEDLENKQANTEAALLEMKRAFSTLADAMETLDYVS